MNANFWNTQNIVMLSVGLLAIPTGAAAGLYLLKKSNASKNARTPQIEISAPAREAKTEVIEMNFEPAQNEDENPELTFVSATVSEPAVEQEPVAQFEAPVKAIAVQPKAEREQIMRLLGRFTKAVEESELHEHYVELREAVENSPVVERIHKVTFNLKNLHLDHRDETYLVSAMQNSPAMRKYRNHPDTKLLILGYASKDNDRRNKRFALNRAKSTEDAIHAHEEVFGFDGMIKSWCIGETDSLSYENNEDCSQHNRAAEIWLIVSDHPVFDEIESDDFTDTTIRQTTHSHGKQH